MKLILCLFMLTSSFSALSSSKVHSSENLSVKRVPITIEDLERRVPQFRNLWNEKVTLFNGSKIYKQEGLFKLDGIQYVQVEFEKEHSKIKGHSIYNVEKRKAELGVLTNKIRLMVGVPPISRYDNEPIMLCRIEPDIGDVFFEMSQAQFKMMKIAYPSDKEIGHHCASLGTSRPYWKDRLNDFAGIDRLGW